MQAEWTDIYHVLFGRLLDEKETATWEELLDDDFPGRGVDKRGRWNPEELIEALRYVSESRRKEGRKGRPPEYSEVKTAIIRARWTPDDQRDDAPRSDCDLCSPTGSVTLFHGISTPATLEQYHLAYQTVIACRCAKGRKVEKYIGRADDRTWREVCEQHSEFVRLLEEWVARNGGSANADVAMQ